MAEAREPATPAWACAVLDEIAELPAVARKPHKAKRVMPFQALCAAAERHGWRVDLVHFADIVVERPDDMPVWILRITRNPAAAPGHYQIQYAESRNPDLSKALPLMAAACVGKVRAWA